MERRTFLTSAGAATLAGAAIAPTFAEIKKEDIAMVNSLTFTHEPQKLKFNPAKLAGISEKLIVSHWENNYIGAVKALNDIRKKLDQMRTSKDVPAYVYNDIKREHLMRTGSVVNHELYFENLGGNGKAGDTIQKALSTSFGGYSSWEEEFKKIGNGLGGGTGWVVLGYNHHLKILENYWAADHMHGIVDTTPILIMDMYEHAYQMDYGAAAAKYIDTFFKNIDWMVVQQRFEKIKNVTQVIS